MAKVTAGYHVSQMIMLEKEGEMVDLEEDDIVNWQNQAGLYEQITWIKYGASSDSNGLWRNIQGRIVLPAELARGKTAKNIELWWHPYLYHTIADYVKRCNICQQYNSHACTHPHTGSLPPSLSQVSGVIYVVSQRTQTCRTGLTSPAVTHSKKKLTSKRCLVGWLNELWGS